MKQTNSVHCITNVVAKYYFGYCNCVILTSMFISEELVKFVMLSVPTTSFN